MFFIYAEYTPGVAYVGGTEIKLRTGHVLLDYTRILVGPFQEISEVRDNRSRGLKMLPQAIGGICETRMIDQLVDGSHTGANSLSKAANSPLLRSAIFALDYIEVNFNASDVKARA